MNLELCLFSILLVPFAAAGLALIPPRTWSLAQRGARHAGCPVRSGGFGDRLRPLRLCVGRFHWRGDPFVYSRRFALGLAGCCSSLCAWHLLDGSDAAGLSRSLVLCLELFAVGLAAIIR